MLRQNIIPLIRFTCIGAVLWLGLFSILGTGGNSDSDTPPTTTSWELTMEKNDLDNDGAIDEVIAYAYDTDGRVSEKRHYAGPDTNIAPDTIDSYVYDADGNRIQENRDNDGNGTVDEVSVYVYQDDRIAEERIYAGSSVTGNPVQTHPYTYDNQGRYSVSYDNNNDGDVDLIVKYDTRDNVIETQDDSQAYDGTFPFRTVSVLSYDATGKYILSESVTSYHNGVEIGSQENKYVYTYDDNGNTEKKEDQIYSNPSWVTVSATYFVWEEA